MTTSQIAGQTAFDIDDLIREATLDAAPPWTGAPLGYTEDYYTPAELAAAYERWVLENGRFDCIGRSGMWRHTLTHEPLELNGHTIHVLTAARPSRESTRPTAQANCPDCRWHLLGEDENGVVEAAHDHALPGWRDLPIAPTKIGSKLSHYSKTATASVLEWMESTYPRSMLIPGAPILTPRVPPAHRHVPGRSPLGGYDIATFGVQ